MIDRFRDKYAQTYSRLCGGFSLFSLNSAVVARASTPQPLWVGTNVAQLAEQAPIHWVSGGANREQPAGAAADGRRL